MPERTQLDEASRWFDGIISPLKALSAVTGRLAIRNHADNNQNLLPEDPRERFWDPFPGRATLRSPIPCPSLPDPQWDRRSGRAWRKVQTDWQASQNATWRGTTSCVSSAGTVVRVRLDKRATGLSVLVPLSVAA
jgi:hypothetical protein